MDRVKMPRIKRASQFAPFDALKGLQEAIKLKDYEHERVEKREISEEKAKKISDILICLTKNDILTVKYFDDGYYKTIQGKAKLLIETQQIQVDGISISLDNIQDLVLFKPI